MDCNMFNIMLLSMFFANSCRHNQIPIVNSVDKLLTCESHLFFILMLK